MKKMFWGVLFLFIDINLGRLCVTPAWAGYLLIWSGLGEVPECGVFQSIRTLTVGAAVFHLLIWLKNLLGIYISAPFAEAVLTAVGLCLQLLITYRIVEGVRELEAIYNHAMESDGLLAVWKVMLAGIVVAYAVNFIFPVLATVSMLITIAAGIYYAVKFWQAAKAYEKAVRRQ